MAKLKQTGTAALAGSIIDGQRCVQRGGQVYLRKAKNGSIKNERHTPQMRQRLLFNSSRLLWTPLKRVLAGNFESVAPEQSAYTAFCRLNGGRGVFLDQQEQEMKCSVITPVVFAEGSLSPIAQQLDGQQRVTTDISLGSLEVTAETTIADFSAAVVTNNRCSYGDELVFVAVMQEDGGGLPRCRAERTEVRLDRSDQRRLQAVCGTTAFASHEGCLTSAPALPAGCYGYCRISTARGTRKVSTQQLVNNNGEMLAEYTSRQKFDAACADYGGCHDDYLTPSQFAPVVYE